MLTSNSIGVSNVGFPIEIPLRGIACNCSRIARNFQAQNCAQVKSTCVGNHTQTYYPNNTNLTFHQLKERVEKKAMEQKFKFNDTTKNQ